MKIGERGQATIPKQFRSRFGLAPATDVEFAEQNGQLILKKTGTAAHAIRKFTGILKGGGVRSDEVVEAMRGR
jgi:AbrB family looped-hinge helix DNA binding protein